jgi:hypothetical protein
MAERPRPQPRPELLTGWSPEVALQAELQARELLSRHPGLIAPEVVEMVAQREMGFAVQRYGESRFAGRANDNGSKKPGLTAYVTPEARDYVVEVFKREGYGVPQIEEVTPELIAVRLPKGVYGMGLGGAQFFVDESDDNGDKRKAEKPFVLRYKDVVRVEGDADELWQNHDYNWDGTRKESHSL